MSEVENTAAEVKATEAKAPVAKIDAAAEKAYAEASAKAVEAPKVEAAPVAKKIAAPKKAPAAKKATPVKKAAAKTVKKTATKTPVKKPVLARKAAVKTSKPAAPKTNPVIKLKDTIMATAKNTDIAATAKDVIADVQTRAKTAYAQTTVLASEATEFTKANVEAVVESGKIFIAGAQELLKDNVETGKTVIETVTEDAKKVAAVKSPTELMQLQGEIARRNFDALVSYGSKRTEAWVKLYNEAFAPISNRVSVAAEKIKKAA
ncbi:phasin family protein [Erythromicrobium ramosum]|jgi:phasin family protein|uniref:Phasin family protein n=1 Tax=Erythrobacter ramosus TaxID=35811 RepID=A0A6I4UHX4_9SPHN|nr:phasin family protein [Erythrobacter ramosus]MBB3774236.1 phasin family protein [Erythrobacter ramosus]MXP38106.1 TIGR01841 family phasin [Erythrobacter ramosus]